MGGGGEQLLNVSSGPPHWKYIPGKKKKKTGLVGSNRKKNQGDCDHWLGPNYLGGRKKKGCKGINPGTGMMGEQKR